MQAKGLRRASWPVSHCPVKDPDGTVLNLPEDLREQFGEGDRCAQGREQGLCGTEEEMVWNECGVGGHRIKERAKEVTGVELIRDDVRVVCGKTGEQHVD